MTVLKVYDIGVGIDREINGKNRVQIQTHTYLDTYDKDGTTANHACSFQ